ncbi:MAG TPA: GNAT family N-acetyltransferase [Longimicrobium sp.]|nr:GNAT family N-acetyltransferase [Longimicrobium sp.]
MSIIDMGESQPILHTGRLVLRPFTADDARAVHDIVSDREIAYNTLTIPHPYPDGMAEEWIRTHPRLFEHGEGVVYAVTLRDTGEVVAAVGVTLEPPHRRAELGYWVGRPHWNRGYATEAARALLRYCFETLNLNRVQAHHFTRNPASGIVMRKLGMTYEGRLRRHTYKWGQFEDIEMYGILRDELDPRG